ncbi:MAG: hypothetical protein A2808_03585 [Candidatus Moranbacteria bacterium RIFCSPHIGHO2_01_FULL_55_24]|nr:MAG: hypothetical protein A2808_03585 [Candidatus Moranbacteria bacterium RIFCSPHIGHO2_01_FULL_55_24]
MKKVFYGSLTLLVLTLIFLGAYNFAFKNNSNSPVAETGKNEAVIVPEAGEDSVAVSLVKNPINEPLLGAVMGGDEKVYYYSFDDKALKKATLEGKDKSVLLSNLPGEPSRIVWSPKRDKALLSIKLDGRNIWHTADLQTKSLVALKPEVTRVAWTNLGDKIFYLYTDPKNSERSLNIANPDGSSWKELAKLGARDAYLSAVPQSSSVSFWSRPNALEKTVLESVSSDGTGRKTLFGDGYGSDYLWSPDGEKIVMSGSSEKGGNTLSVSLLNKNGGEARSLALPTLVSKIVWSRDSAFLYYALPGGLPENATLPNDYFEKSLATKDTFWKMDIETGKKTRLLEPKDVAQSFDSTDLFLSSEEDALFFTDRQSGRLHRIDL